MEASETDEEEEIPELDTSEMDIDNEEIEDENLPRKDATETGSKKLLQKFRSKKKNKIIVN